MPFMYNQTLYNAHLELPAALDTPTDFHPLYDDILSAAKEHIELHIKKQGIFSDWLHALKPGDEEFELRGPFVATFASA